MIFTDKFITIPIKLSCEKDVDLTGKTETKDSFRRIDPMQIETYGPGMDTEHPDEPCTMIDFKSGDSIAAYLSFEAFEAKLNAWQPEQIYHKQ